MRILWSLLLLGGLVASAEGETLTLTLTPTEIQALQGLYEVATPEELPARLEARLRASVQGYTANQVRQEVESLVQELQRVDRVTRQRALQRAQDELDAAQGR